MTVTLSGLNQGATATPLTAAMGGTGSSTITGIVKAAGTAWSAATVRTDYAEPTNALATGLLKNTTTTGAHTIAAPGVDYGYGNIPQNSKSAAYTTVLADAGGHILHPAADAVARTFTIDSNANVAYPIGTCIGFVNLTAQVVTIAITTDTMYLAGLGTTGSRSLAQYGVANALKIAATTWIISGSGLT